MPLDPDFRVPVMCLTQDGLALSHSAQAARLCAAGAKWIQLRMKHASTDAWLATAREVVAICHAHNAKCTVNDSVDIALAAGADGVHLGKGDLTWREARHRIGPRRVLGGTVNNEEDAARAIATGCVDYVGVGPLRFTATKQKLAPLLGIDGVQTLIARLAPMPAWVIGGVEAADLPALREAGAAGVAVSGVLFRGERLEASFAALQSQWRASPASRAPVGLEAAVTTKLSS